MVSWPRAGSRPPGPGCYITRLPPSNDYDSSWQQVLLFHMLCVFMCFRVSGLPAQFHLWQLGAACSGHCLCRHPHMTAVAVMFTSSSANDSVMGYRRWVLICYHATWVLPQVAWWPLCLFVSPPVSPTTLTSAPPTCWVRGLAA